MLVLLAAFSDKLRIYKVPSLDETLDAVGCGLETLDIPGCSALEE